MSAPRVDYSNVFAGATFAFEGYANKSLAGATVTCSVKRYRDASGYLGQISTLTGELTIDPEDDTHYFVRFGAHVTALWPIAALWHDVQAEPSPGVVRSLQHGRLHMRQRATRTRPLPAAFNTGTLVAALPSPTLAAQAELEIAGSLSATLPAPSLGAAGDLPLSGSLAASLPAPSLSAQGALHIAGSLASSVPAPLLSAQGNLHISGSLAATLAAPTLAAQGVLTVTLSQILSILGARLHWWYEVGVSTETLNGSNFSQLNDLGPGGYHAAQATVGNQPAKTTAGGPGGKNCITYQSTTRHLFSTAMSLSAGRALTFFAVTKRESAPAFRVNCSARTGDGVSLGSTVVYYGADANANGFEAAAKVSGQAVEDRVLTSPPADTAWHVWSTRFAAGVAPVLKVDNAATAPLFTTVGLADAVEAVALGHPSVAAGSLYMKLAVENCTADEEALIRAYITQQTGL